MSNETPRLNLETFEQGDENWDHTDTVEAVDEHAIDRGPIEERPEEGEYDDELYHATDQRIVWRWDADAEDWKAASGLGSEDEPVPGTSYHESLSVERAGIIEVDEQPTEDELEAGLYNHNGTVYIRSE